MDVVAHGLWGGALFYRQGRKQFLAAALLGMAPDLLSFGVFHMTQPGWLAERLLGNISGPPALASLPPYVFHSYNVTHSMIVWAAGFALLWALIKKPPWLFTAWLLHIVCDIPTHVTRYFPTPFLWPLPTPFVDGVPWSTPWLMAANYAAMFFVYCWLAWHFRRTRQLN
ncbi:MAG: hypothetical protein ACXWYD_22105 [Candidatus Binatia bacterium]